MLRLFGPIASAYKVPVVGGSPSAAFECDVILDFGGCAAYDVGSPEIEVSTSTQYFNGGSPYLGTFNNYSGSWDCLFWTSENLPNVNHVSGALRQRLLSSVSSYINNAISVPAKTIDNIENRSGNEIWGQFLFRPQVGFTGEGEQKRRDIITIRLVNSTNTEYVNLVVQSIHEYSNTKERFRLQAYRRNGDTITYYYTCTSTGTGWTINSNCLDWYYLHGVWNLVDWYYKLDDTNGIMWVALNQKELFRFAGNTSYGSGNSGIGDGSVQHLLGQTHTSGYNWDYAGFCYHHSSTPPGELTNETACIPYSGSIPDTSIRYLGFTSFS
jgi:hypothetical protein